VGFFLFNYRRVVVLNRGRCHASVPHRHPCFSLVFFEFGECLHFCLFLFFMWVGQGLCWVDGPGRFFNALVNLRKVVVPRHDTFFSGSLEHLPSGRPRSSDLFALCAPHFFFHGTPRPPTPFCFHFPYPTSHSFPLLVPKRLRIPDLGVFPL